MAARSIPEIAAECGLDVWLCRRAAKNIYSRARLELVRLEDEQATRAAAQAKAAAPIACSKRLPGCDGTFEPEAKVNGRECPSCYRTRKASDVRRWRARTANPMPESAVAA
jgi:hypothetical protein